MPGMSVNEQKHHFRAKRRERADKFANALRHDLEGPISYLLQTCQSEEERRDVKRLWSVLTDICDKHRRKAERY